MLYIRSFWWNCYPTLLVLIHCIVLLCILFLFHLFCLVLFWLLGFFLPRCTNIGLFEFYLNLCYLDYIFCLGPLPLFSSWSLLYSSESKLSYVRIPLQEKKIPSVDYNILSKSCRSSPIRPGRVFIWVLFFSLSLLGTPLSELHCLCLPFLFYLWWFLRGFLTWKCKNMFANDHGIESSSGIHIVSDVTTEACQAS